MLGWHFTATLIQVYFNTGLSYWLFRRFDVAWCVAEPGVLIGASNFFELAAAAAISLFGLQSRAATGGWYEGRA